MKDVDSSRRSGCMLFLWRFLKVKVASSRHLRNQYARLWSGGMFEQFLEELTSQNERLIRATCKII